MLLLPYQLPQCWSLGLGRTIHHLLDVYHGVSPRSSLQVVDGEVFQTVLVVDVLQVLYSFGERSLHLLKSFDVCLISGPERATVFNGWYYKGF